MFLPPLTSYPTPNVPPSQHAKEYIPFSSRGPASCSDIPCDEGAGEAGVVIPQTTVEVVIGPSTVGLPATPGFEQCHHLPGAAHSLSPGQHHPATVAGGDAENDGYGRAPSAPGSLTTWQIHHSVLNWAVLSQQ